MMLNGDETYTVCIGEINNASDSTWKDIVVEVRYFNADGDLTDTVTEHLYDHIVPPGKSAAFRIWTAACKKQDEYSSHKAVVTFAEPRQPSTGCDGRPFPSLEMFSLWGPLMLIIGIWIFVMKKFYSGKNSPQSRLLKIQENMAALVKEQNQCHERLACAVEKIAQNKKVQA